MSGLGRWTKSSDAMIGLSALSQSPTFSPFFIVSNPEGCLAFPGLTRREFHQDAGSLTSPFGSRAPACRASATPSACARRPRAARSARGPASLASARPSATLPAPVATTAEPRCARAQTHASAWMLPRRTAASPTRSCAWTTSARLALASSSLSWIGSPGACGWASAWVSPVWWRVPSRGPSVWWC
jgi:hypothetical protein